MATNTWVALNTTTVATATPSITFTSINQGYTDLVLVVSAATTHSASTFLRVDFNSDTTAGNYSYVDLSGNGTVSEITTRGNNAWLGGNYNSISTVLGESTSVSRIKGYSNSTTFKSYIARTGRGSTSLDYFGTGLTAGTWRNTAPVTSVTIYNTRGGVNYNFAVGTTVSLYGIKAWSNIEATPKATGGYVYSDSTYWYHAFPFSSTFTPNQSLTADVLVIAGGGGGGGFTGGNGNGGGGAGGLLAYSSQSLTATGYTCTIGAGGAGGLTASGSTNGANSQFGALTASVGGGRGAHGGSAPNGSSTGGSGGGGQGSNDLTYVNGSAGTSGQGFAGGNGHGSGNFAGGGGGGGAGAAGANGTDGLGGTGGTGATSTLINAIGLATGYGQLVSGNYYFAGGGGGSTSSNSTSGIALGGNGGGGTGYYDGGPAGGAGISGLGGGGGAGRAANGGNGGSGIVVIRYAK